jgi:hypothetical protein
MNWTTLYITGRNDFRDDVRKKLENSKLDVMSGYLESSTAKGHWDLYWINDQYTLRDVKEAIGSKLVWKYRLRFFQDLEEFIETGNDYNTRPAKDEEKQLEEVLKWMANAS